MNRQIFIFGLVMLLVSCDKKKQSLKRLDGDWEVTGYQETIFDGTTNYFDVLSGEAAFETSKKSDDGKASITWKAIYVNDTTEFDFDGLFVQKALDELKLMSNSDTLKCKITRQLKKDMSLEMIVNTDRKSFIHLRKK